MTDDSPNPEPPIVPAHVATRRWAPSLIWLVPAAAALFGLALIFNAWRGMGPQIRISFRTAEGLEIGKTLVKYRNVAVGHVTAIEARRRSGPCDRHRGAQQDGRPYRDARHQLLGSPSALRNRLGFGTRHFAVGNLHRSRGGRLAGVASRLRRPGGATGADARRQRPARRAARGKPRLDRGRRARLLPALRGRPGHRAAAGGRRQRCRNRRVHRRSERPPRQSRDPILERERRRRHARSCRPQDEDRIARDRARRRHRLRRRAGGIRVRTGRRQGPLHTVRVRSRSDGAARR